MLSYLRKNMKTIMIVVAVLFAASMFYYGIGGRAGTGGPREKKTGIATVNGKEIDQFRFNQNLQRLASGLSGVRTPQEIAYFQMLALGQAVDYTLMLNEAKKSARVSGGEVDNAIKQIMEMNKIPSKAAFEEALKRNGFTLDLFKKMIREDILIQKMVSKIKGGVAISPDDLREVRASHVLVSPRMVLITGEADEKKAAERADKAARALAEEVLVKARAGANFPSLAKQYSDDPGSKDKGGDLGFFTAGTMLPEFDKAVFALKPGEISGVVKSPFGYHVIKLIDTRLRAVPNLEKGKDMKEVILAEKQENVFNQWLYSIKQKAKIEIINPVLKAYDFRLRGQVDAAIAEYNMAIADNPSDAYLHILLGDTYREIGNIDLTIAEYIKATSLNSSDPTLFIALGKGYEDAAKIKGEAKYRASAIEQYKKASILSGDSKELHEELANIFKRLGEGSLERAERAKIAQIAVKQKFEEEIKKKSGEQPKP